MGRGGGGYEWDVVHPAVAFTEPPSVWFAAQIFCREAVNGSKTARRSSPPSSLRPSDEEVLLHAIDIVTSLKEDTRSVHPFLFTNKRFDFGLAHRRAFVFLSSPPR